MNFKKIATAAVAVSLAAASVLTLGGCNTVLAKDVKGIDFTSFEAKDLDGNKVTQDTFKDYDITMVNVWKTDCQFCVEELPYLEHMYENKDANVNIISVCMDGADEADTAKQEVEQAGVTFQTIAPTGELAEEFQKSIDTSPTTFFVNSKGEMVGEVQYGVVGDDQKSITSNYQKLLDKALEESKQS